VVGDGEICFVEFLEYVKKHGSKRIESELEEIQGLAFIGVDQHLHFSGFGKPLAAQDLVLADYEILAVGLRDQGQLLANYFRPGAGSSWYAHDERAHETARRAMLAHIVVSKGCVARCTFCQRSTRGFRAIKPERVEAHLLTLKERYNVGFIHIPDENFGADRKHARAIAEILARHDMLWAATGVRCTSLKPEDIQFFKDHLCVGLKFGVESGSQKILDLMEKRFTSQNVTDAIRTCTQHEIYSPMAVMVGMPGETTQTASETGRFLGTVSSMVGIPPHLFGSMDIFYAMPLPATPLYEYGQQIGVIGSGVEAEEQYLDSLAKASPDKSSYINLNGAPIREVLFWDTVAALEASRTYRALAKKVKPILSLQKRQRLLKSILLPANGPSAVPQTLKTESKASKIKRKLKDGTLLPTIFVNLTRKTGNQFIRHHLIGNRLIDFLPRPFIYPPIKFALYLEYLSMRMFQRKQAKSNYLGIYSKVSAPARLQASPGLSLRDLVEKNRPTAGSLTEKSVQTLMAGQ
jgi:hypothetical protein